MDLQARRLPTSDVLKQRKKEITEFLKNDKLNWENKIFAENFFLDRSKEKRTSEILEILEKAGAIKNVQKYTPRNQLRGDFDIQCENGNINIFFTLTPEKTPKIQRLDVSFKSGIKVRTEHFFNSKAHIAVNKLCLLTRSNTI